MNKVGIFVATRWQGAEDVVARLRAAVEAEVPNVWQTSSWNDPEATAKIEGTDVIICLGGDGSMLWASRAVVPHAVPIFGVNMGRLGFLAEIGPEELMARLPAVLAGEGRVEERAMLQTQVPAWGQTFQGLNDTVVSRNRAGRPVYLDVSIDGDRLTIYRADAVIVASATGSTGYSLSAGGPILHPESRNLVLTPVAPHVTSARSLVLPSDSVVDLTIHADDGATVSVDGQVNRELRSGETVSVCRSAHLARFLRLSEPTHYYRVLAERLDWLKSVDPDTLFGPEGGSPK